MTNQTQTNTNAPAPALKQLVKRKTNGEKDKSGYYKLSAEDGIAIFNEALQAEQSALLKNASHRLTKMDNAIIPISRFDTDGNEALGSMVIPLEIATFTIPIWANPSQAQDTDTDRDRDRGSDNGNATGVDDSEEMMECLIRELIEKIARIAEAWIVWGNLNIGLQGLEKKHDTSSVLYHPEVNRNKALSDNSLGYIENQGENIEAMAIRKMASLLHRASRANAQWYMSSDVGCAIDAMEDAPRLESQSVIETGEDQDMLIPANTKRVKAETHEEDLPAHMLGKPIAYSAHMPFLDYQDDEGGQRTALALADMRKAYTFIYNPYDISFKEEGVGSVRFVIRIGGSITQPDAIRVLKLPPTTP